MISELEQKEPKSNCNGRVFRARENWFFNKRGEYVYQQRMYPLKSMSCPGCEQCVWIEDEIYEYMDSGTIPVMPAFDHGMIYKLAIINIGVDEYGYVDSCDMAFVEVI